MSKRAEGRRQKTSPAAPAATLRLAAFAGLMSLAFAALIGRLTQVQLVEGTAFAAAAKTNQIRRIPVPAPRGRILDRHGVVLARSRPSFACALVPADVRDIKAVMRELSATLQIPEAKLWKRLLHHRGIDYASFDDVVGAEPYGPVLLATDLTSSQMARVGEAQSRLRGIDLQAQAVRNYPYGRAGAHFLGYVGSITEAEYRELRSKGYSPNDVVGKDGLEAVYDDALRGRPGGDQIEVNAQGQPVNRLGALEPVPGDSVSLTIDWRLQEIAERALHAQIEKIGAGRGGRLSGAVVVLDPWTGGVLAMASQPAFDPNDFAAGISSAKYAQYATDKLQPLFHRAIGAATPTGSTFKMVTGSAALSSGVIGKNQVLYDSGAWNCHGQLFRDIAAGGLGYTNFIHALAASSDGYFYQLADRLGNDRLRFYARQYGLGSKLGIDLPGEYPGNWPTNEWMLKVFGTPMVPADACSLGIGQGAMQATPLQMANITATVANGGTLYRPHFLAMIKDTSGKVVRRIERSAIIRRVAVTAEAISEVQAGMAQVTDPGGTAYGLAIPGLKFSGKTGTVETDGGSGPNTTWFVAYAPTRRPTLALAVFMERSGGYGAGVAAPIAREIIVNFLGANR